MVRWTERILRSTYSFQPQPYIVSSSSFIFSTTPNTFQEVKTDWRFNNGAVFAGPQVWIPAFISNAGLKLLAVLLSFSSQPKSFLQFFICHAYNRIFSNELNWHIGACIIICLKNGLLCEVAKVNTEWGATDQKDMAIRRKNAIKWYLKNVPSELLRLFNCWGS